MKKTGFGWTKCWVSVQAQQKKAINTARASSAAHDTAIMLTWQPTSAKPSKVIFIYLFIIFTKK
jgi:hypothetical protein